MKVVDVMRLLSVLGVANIREPDGGVGEVWASCPLGTHRDSDPSFQIVSDPTRESHGYWRCFGCSEHGGLVGLVRKVRGVDGFEARRILANVENEIAGRVAKRASVSVSLSLFGAKAFNEPASIRRPPSLAEWSTPFRDYVTERGITAGQVVRWRLGYSVTGMRVHFPIEDEGGRLCSYTARTIVGATQRYMTPDPVENPVPGAIFGRRWWPARGRRRLVILNEGAINALAVERATGAHVGALGHSSLLPEQLIHLASFDVLVSMTDPDRAGDRIAEEYRNANPTGRFMRARLPEGCDAATASPDLILETLNAAGVSARILSWSKGDEPGNLPALAKG